ncbi:hypothetical protein SELMODRAFT_403742 [Selaginella moellendorffii]|uniref:Uncharacterized protein n=1 Tax=Selaginella moellendorffii TaxID=88036 RepID=D8QSD8_SELML|nr:hypothetical protein SELMODRAFT_403742 [Selaginella moellendorffii]
MVAYCWGTSSPGEYEHNYSLNGFRVPLELHHTRVSAIVILLGISSHTDCWRCVCRQHWREGFRIWILANLLGWRRYQKAGNHWTLLQALPADERRPLTSWCDYSVLQAITTPYMRITDGSTLQRRNETDVELNCRAICIYALNFGPSLSVMQSIGFLGNLAMSIRLLCSHGWMLSRSQDCIPSIKILALAMWEYSLIRREFLLVSELLQQLFVLEQHIQQAVDQPDKSSMKAATPEQAVIQLHQ